jgi:hypothetical protein
VQSGLQSSVFAATVFPARDSLRLGLLFFLAARLGSSLHDGTMLGNHFEERIRFPVSRAPRSCSQARWVATSLLRFCLCCDWIVAGIHPGYILSYRIKKFEVS